MSPDATPDQGLVRSGTRIGHYQIVGRLGSGAMGDVYRARDTRLGREIALKLLPESRLHDDAAREQAEREARIIASLNHPNVLALFDVGVLDGAMFIVTE